MQIVTTLNLGCDFHVLGWVVSHKLLYKGRREVLSCVALGVRGRGTQILIALCIGGIGVLKVGNIKYHEFELGTVSLRHIELPCQLYHLLEGPPSKPSCHLFSISRK